MRTQPRRRRPQKTIALLVQPASAAAGVRIFTGGGLDLLRSRLGPGSVRQLPMIKGLALCDSASIRIPVSIAGLSWAWLCRFRFSVWKSRRRGFDLC